MEKKRGTVKLRHPNGKVMAKGKVRNYKKQGLWKFYYDSGKLASTTVYINDTANGPYMEYLQDGRVKQQGRFCMNHKCGNWIHYNDAGHLISSENFSNDIQDGVQRFWYENGQLRDSLLFTNGYILYRKGWYPNGKLKLIETYSNGAPEGTWVTYPDPEVTNDTFPATKDEYSGGVRNGWHWAWNGNVLVEKFHYVNGQLDGEATRYAEDRTVLSIEHYKDGLRDGSATWFKNGRKLKTEQYNYGQKNGTWEEFDRSEKVLKREWYTNDVMDSSIAYYPNGRKAISRKGNAARGWVWCQVWDTAGVYLMDGTEVSDLRQGDWCSYYPDGKVRACTSYDKGVITGYHKNYPNGKPMVQYKITGEKTFNEEAWTEKGKPIAKGTKQFDELIEGNRPGEMLVDPSQFTRSIIGHSISEMRGEANEDFETFKEVQEVPADTEVFLNCEVMPEFPGGEAGRQKFIASFLTDPRGSVDDREGTVYVEYIVEKDGSVTHVKVRKGIPASADLDQAAVDVVTKFPKHSPALNQGKPVRCSLVVPVKFVAR